MARVQWNQRELDRLLRERDGAVGRDLRRRALRVEAAAKAGCPVDTGHLRSSITSGGVERDEAGLHVDVGTDVSYALSVELGSRPHKIRSHGDYPLRSASGEVFGREVDHPGTQAQPFLRPALRAAE